MTQVGFDEGKRTGMFRRLNARVCPRLAVGERARGESGFTLIEAVLAMTLFAIISTALLSVLVSGVSAQSLSRQKTIAEQATTAQLEHIRTLQYSDVGNPGRNPNGIVPLTQTVAAVLGTSTPGLSATVTTKIEWNNSSLDKVATSYRNAAFYKKVTITVTRSSDSKQLAQMVTYVADVNGGTGVADAEIDVNVLDLGTAGPISGQDVTLKDGPSTPSSATWITDTTDAAGSIIFPALLSNPTSGATAYYNLSMTPPSGYTLLKDDDINVTPSSTNAHIQLAPSQIFPSTLRVYKGSTINVQLKKASNGADYGGNATVTLSTTLRGAATSQNYPYAGATLPINTFSGEKIIPAPSSVVTGGYTAAVSGGFYATSVTKATVPNAYPTDLTSTFTLTGYPTGTVTATVTWAGSPVSGATVTMSGGPAAGWGPKTATTNGSGVATFNDVPEGSGYSLTATKGGQTSSAVSATAVGGSTVNVPIAMPVGSVAVTVTSAATPVSGATVSLSGGNISGTITAGTTTDATGKVTVPNVPAGSGITVTATKGSLSGSTSSVSVTGGNTTNVTVDMPVGTVVVTVTWTNSSGANATVTLSGGPLGSGVTGTADSTGKITFNNVPPFTNYTVTAQKGGQSKANTGVSVSGGVTTPVSVSMPTGSITATVTWATNPVSGATVSVTGGNIVGTITAGSTTNSSGQVTISNVPAGSGMTVTATKSSQTGTATSVSVTGGSTTTVPVAMPVGTFVVTVNQPSGTPADGASVTLSGGPMSISVPGTTNSSGQVTFNNVPAGTGYTVAGSRYGQNSSVASQSVTGGGSTPVTVNLAAYAQGNIAIVVKRSGGSSCNSTAFNWTISGGPYSYTQTGTNTTASSGGTLGTFGGVPAGSGYTVTVTKVSNSSQKGTATGVTVTSGGTVTANVTLNTNTCP